MGAGGAPDPQTPAHSELTLRVISAIVLGALVLALTWWGGWPFNLLWLLAGLAVLAEWLRMVKAEPFRPLFAALSLALAAAAALVVANAGPVLSLIVVGLGLGASLAIGRSRNAGLWAAAGALCAGVLVVVPAAIRRPEAGGFFAPEFGRDILFLLYGIVWATDIGAYFAGRAVGGPKLLPRVSPKKTWSGAVGGLVAANAAAFALLASVGMLGRDTQAIATLVLVATGFSVVSQVGDLLESALKRHFGAKDSSHLIPGHGGVMDRLDGFFAVCAVLAITRLVELASR
jgi:phosphatidate cytidylyltransferase